MTGKVNLKEHFLQKFKLCNAIKSLTDVVTLPWLFHISKTRNFHFWVNYSF